MQQMLTDTHSDFKDYFLDNLHSMHRAMGLASSRYLINISSCLSFLSFL